MIEANELIVDNFAGGGGASTGIELALGRHVDVAINHSPEAIAVHKANHPHTRHYCENVWDVVPRKVCGGRRVGLGHFSPSCVYFSRAKGGQPLDKKVRALACVATRWAREVKPRVIVLENVEEFLQWGPLDNEGKPIKAKAGQTYRCWLGKLRAQGYRTEHRVLNAADYGAPTTRKRYFLVARSDGEAIRWPRPSHGPGLAKPWRSAAEIIDWSDLGTSIFGRSRPLVENTMKRIAEGVRRYVLGPSMPFVLEPDGDTLVVPTLVQSGYGERPGQTPRVPGLEKPLGTVVGDQKHRLVAAFLTRHYGGVVGREAQLPLSTVTAKDHHALTTAELREVEGCPEDVRAFLVKYYGAGGKPESQQQSLLSPLHTITTKARFGLVVVHGRAYRITDIKSRMLKPAELFRAQSFGPDYVIDPLFNGKPLTATAQIQLAGNSVCPVVERAVVEANFGVASAPREALS